MNAVTPLGSYSAPPLGVRAVARLAEGYAGPCMRVVRARDGAEADIGFDAQGRVDLRAARDFAGTEVLSAGVLWVGLWYDQAGANHLAGRPGACPSLCSERDAFGNGFADCGFVLQDGAKDFYPQPLSRAMDYPETFLPDFGDVATFLVARPTVSLSGNAWITLGDPSDGPFLALLTAERSASTPGGLTLAHRSAAGSDETWAAAGDIAALPRVNPHCLGLVSRRNGVTVFSEDRALLPPVPLPPFARAPRPGGPGATATSGFHAANDLYAAVDFPGAITDGEAQAVMRALAAAFATEARANRLVFDGSSTPRGQGAEANIAYPKIVQGGLDRPVDVFNISVNGYTIDDLAANCRARALPLIRPGVNCIYCPDGVTNSIARGETAQAAFGKLGGLCRLVRAAGARVIVPTAKNRGDLGAAQQAERAAFNALVRAGWREALGAEGLLDVDAIPETQEPSDSRYFQPDGIHNRSPVHVLIGRLAAAVVAPLLV